MTPGTSRPGTSAPDLGDAGRIADPDELAGRWFGGVAAQAAGGATAELSLMDGSESRYESRRQGLWPWNEVAERICAEIGIAVDGPVTRAPHGTHPAMLVPPDHIIKLYPRWSGGHARAGHELHTRESETLRLLERDPELAVPRVVADGSLVGTWRYLVLRRIPGTPLADVADDAEVTGRSALAGWLGTMVQRLHAVPLTDAEREAGWSRFKTTLEDRHRTATERLGGPAGMPAHLVAQLDAWLPRPAELLGSPQEAVLTHADLSPAHIIVDVVAGRFHAAGVIDFANAQIGHPLFEIGPIWWHTLRAEPGLLKAFLSAAQLPGYDEPGFARQALAWAILNPRWGWADLPGAADVGDLDELAEAAFGGRAEADRVDTHTPTVNLPAGPREHEVLARLESLARSEDDYRLAQREAEPWVGAAAIACERHRLATDSGLHPVTSGSRPAIQVAGEYLVKFYGPWDWGDILFDREILALRRLDADPELPVTRLIADGRLSEHWRYAILSWLDGDRLKDVDEGLWARDAAGLVTWLGRFVRALHALDMKPDEHTAVLAAHREILAHRHREATRRARERNLLPPHLLAQIDTWLPPLEELLEDSPGVVLVHADVVPSNVIGRVRAAGFEPTRVIDFNQSVVAPALYELGPIWWTILEGRPGRTRRFLAEARLPGLPDAIPPRHALAWAVLNPAWRPQPFTWLESMGNLDDVAARSFGGDHE